MPEKLNVGTLYVRGCQDERTRKQIANDAMRYNIQILGITETHIKEEGTNIIKTKYKDKKEDYSFINYG